MPLTTGTAHGPCEIQAPLGARGMGEVYKARGTRLDRSVASKVLPSDLTRDDTATQRYKPRSPSVSSMRTPQGSVRKA